MAEVRCKWVAEAGEYRTEDGETCETPKREHCTARKTCPVHLAWGEQTCGRCVGRSRTDLRQIVERAALMLPEALVAGVDSEAANLAGPACDPEAWTWRKVAAKEQAWYGNGKAWHVSLQDEEDDALHPYRLLTGWAQALTEDYGLTKQRPQTWTITNAADLLERMLHRVAQDEDQDFPLLARELRKCRAHLESVMRDSQAPERGVPCPTCVESGKVDPARVRLVREYAHFCNNPECCREHVIDESEDLWVCPKDAAHQWTPKAYRNYLMERKTA